MAYGSELLSDCFFNPPVLTCRLRDRPPTFLFETLQVAFRCVRAASYLHFI